ncbi:MAG: hypothetical protein E7588_03830 [Ruminococcaceae bacterium]|nr:hypothetical protein [Oscillospiraceae bacterium]
MLTNTEMLNCIFRNVQMGTDSVNAILPDVKDENMRGDLFVQLREYGALARRAEELLANEGESAKDNNIFKKAMTETMAKLNSMKDPSSSHIAEMMINGATMGVIDMTRRLREYGAQSEAIDTLGRDVVKFEENTVTKMKNYL